MPYSIRPVITATVSFVTLATTFTPLHALAARNTEVPGHIQHFESVRANVTTPVDVTGRRSSGDSVPSVIFEAFGRTFDLELEPSPAVPRGSKVHYVTDEGTVTVPADRVYYHGRLRGEDDTIVAVSVRDNQVEGTIITPDGKIFLRPDHRRGRRSGSTLVYRDTDIDPSEIDSSCGKEGTGFEGLVGQFGGGSRPVRRSGNVDVMEMSLVGDYQLFQVLGMGSTDYMLGILNQVSAIYYAEHNVILEAVSTTVFESASASNSVLSTTTDPNTLLTKFNAYRDDVTSPAADGGLAHLFTGRNLTGSTVGIAYMATICSAGTATGLSQRFTSDSSLMALVVGHELGHSFGAGHDGQGPCSDAPSGYIMSAMLSPSTLDEFTQCSQDAIDAIIALNGGCMYQAAAPVCGNGSVEIGETCDDGNTDDGDCCSSTCNFESSGTVCGDDGNVCTDTICDGAGTCGTNNNLNSCDDGGDVCTLPGQCTAGSCVASYAPQPLKTKKSKLKAKMKSGPANDQFNFKGVIPNADMNSRPNTNGFRLELRDSDENIIYTSTVPAGWFVDKNGKGTSFTFKAPKGMQVAGAAGLSQVKIKFQSQKREATVVAKGKNYEVSAMDGQPSVHLEAHIGDDVSGDCATGMYIPCTPKTGQLSCKG